MISFEGILQFKLTIDYYHEQESLVLTMLKR